MTHIHGCNIIGIYALPEKKGLVNNRRIILVDQGPQAVQRYVTALHINGEDTWLSGNYFDNQLKALEDFYKRCKRGY